VATRAEYRTDLNNKLLSIEDSGYGDFEFADNELNTYLELSVARLFPALYKKVVIEEQVGSSYGSMYRSKVATDFADRVFLIVDTNEQTPLYGWRVVGGVISNLDLVDLSGNVDIHYIDAYSMPSNDTDDAGISAIWRPLIVLGALIEALEARQDSGVRGDPAPIGNNVEVPLLDRLIARYETLKSEMAMSLPAVTV
jgi:hypothetical protein